MRFPTKGKLEGPLPWNRAISACSRPFDDAGFADVGTRRLGGVWRHADGQSVVEALRSGTARMAALIAAQPEAAIPVIAADIDRAAADYRDARGLAIPLSAFVAFGRVG